MLGQETKNNPLTNTFSYEIHIIYISRQKLAHWRVFSLRFGLIDLRHFQKPDNRLRIMMGKLRCTASTTVDKNGQTNFDRFLDSLGHNCAKIWGF